MEVTTVDRQVGTKVGTKSVGRNGELTGATLKIGGMSCAACASRVEKQLCELPGVHGAVVNLATESRHRI